MKAPTACNTATLHLNGSSLQIILHATTRYRTKAPLYSLHEAKSLCSTAGLDMRMHFFFLSLPDFMIFTLHLKGKGRACALKAGLQLATNSRDRGRCSLVLPPLSGLPFKRSDSHESPKRP